MNIIYVCRKLMKAKGPAAAKVEEEKKKGLALFGPKPPTPKFLRAFGGTINRNLIDKMKVTALTFLSTCGRLKATRATLTVNCTAIFIFFPVFLWRPLKMVVSFLFLFITPFWESVYS